MAGNRGRGHAGADDDKALVGIGFSFSFYGRAYTSVCISSNGLLSFGGCNTGNLFRFDPTSSRYIYNLSTTGYGAGTYLLRVTLNDQTRHDVQVSLR